MKIFTTNNNFCKTLLHQQVHHKDKDEKDEIKRKELVKKIDAFLSNQ